MYWINRARLAGVLAIIEAEGCRAIIVSDALETNLADIIKAKEADMACVIKGREESEVSYKLTAMQNGPIKSKNKRARREARGW